MKYFTVYTNFIQKILKNFFKNKLMLYMSKIPSRAYGTDAGINPKRS